MARFIEADPDKRFARIGVSGTEARGSGTARMLVAGTSAQSGCLAMADVGTTKIAADPSREDDALDVLEVEGATAKRLVATGARSRLSSSRRTLGVRCRDVCGHAAGTVLRSPSRSDRSDSERLG